MVNPQHFPGSELVERNPKLDVDALYRAGSLSTGQISRSGHHVAPLSYLNHLLGEQRLRRLRLPPHRGESGKFCACHGVPAIGSIREFVLAGGLMSYGARDTDAYRRAGSHYVAPILRGTKPGDLPVEMPSRYELVINIVAAKALGLDVPDRVLALADEVIE